MYTADSFHKDFRGLPSDDRATVKVAVENNEVDTIHFFNAGAETVPGRTIRTWPFKNPDYVIESTSKRTAHALKMFGLARGQTPAAIAIADLGDYLRKVMTVRTLAALPTTTQHKVRAVRHAQKRLLEIEQKELALLPGDSIGQEALRNEVLEILDDLNKDNHNISYSFFHSEGRLGKVVDSLRYRMETFRFPVSGYCRTDQIHPEDAEDGKPFFFKLSSHGKGPHETVAFMQWLYHQRRTAELPGYRNPIQRGFDRLLQVLNIRRMRFQPDKKINPDLDKLYTTQKKFTTSFLTRVARNLSKFLIGVPTSITMGIADGFNFLRQEYLDFKNCHFESAINQREKNALKKLAKKDIEEQQLLSESNSDSSQAKPDYMVLAPERALSTLEHDNIFANLLMPARRMLEMNQEFVLQNPTIYATLVCLGVVPAISVLLPFDMIGILKASGGKSFAGSQAFAQLSVLNHAGAAQNIHALHRGHSTRTLRALDTVSSEIKASGATGSIVSALASGGVGNYFEALDKNLEDPFAFADYILTMTSIGLNQRAMSNHAYRINASLRTALMAETIAFRGYNVYPNVRSIVSSALRFPFQFVSTTARLIASAGLALTGKTEAFTFELKEAGKKIVSSAYAGMSFVSGLAKFTWRTLNYVPKLANELLLTVPSRIIGTAGDMLHTIGDVGRKAHQAIMKKSQFLGGLTALPLRLPAEIMRGAGSLMVGVAKGLKRAKNWFRRNWDKAIFRPGNSLLNRFSNSIDRLFNPEHPVNKATEQIDKLKALRKDIIEKDGGNAPVIQLLDRLIRGLDEYRKAIKSGKNSYKHPDLKKTLQASMLQAASLCQKQALAEVLEQVHSPEASGPAVTELKEALEALEPLRKEQEISASPLASHASCDLLFDEISHKKHTENPSSRPRLRPDNHGGSQSHPHL